MINKYYCPSCGIEMNHHADKVNEAILVQTKKSLGDFSGVIEAVFTCPTCGDTTKSAAQQTKQIEFVNTNAVINEYKPRTSRRLRFTYSGLL